ncbi:MAG TPA: dihydrolipoamide acetyltransferase family protein, partial [Burkholderiales bacterium]|nr:dihydrolipoamide acetyltransferase family protein [Burkholderiales bacterium]
MATKVLVPRLGEGVEEVTVIKWLKHEGESVKELEPLLEVNTDKVDTEIPAPASGTVLKIEAQEGQSAKVGQLLAVIGQAGEKVEGAAAPAPKTDTAKAPPQPSTDNRQPSADNPQPPALSRRTELVEAEVEGSTTNQQPPTINQQPSSEIGFISPVVAKVAAEHGVDLSKVQGTGLNGRVTKNDVLAYVEKGGTARADTSAPARGPAGPQVTALTGDQLVKHTTIRKQIAEHMLMSQRVSPHVLTVMEADLSRVSTHRVANKDIFARDGVNLTYTGYFISAIVAALKAYPLVNSSWTDEGVLIHRAINIGMAVSLGADGLIVPVIKDADNLSLLAIARAIKDLADRARAKKLQPDEVRGGTFTLTNHGTAGSLLAMPIINQPQAGILGAGAIQKRVVAVTDANGIDAIAIRPMIYLSFVFDHR